MPKVLVACEYSGRVRSAFMKAGCEAWSCDLLPSEDDSPYHWQGDVRAALDYSGWDLLIAHPPCTYLANSGARWWPWRQEEQMQALAFVSLLLDSGVPRIALENPPGRIGSQIRPADQYVQPWQFGHPEKKRTGLWLKNLPPLMETDNVHELMSSLPEKEQSRVHWASPGPNRWKERSRTYLGIAAAMADQWAPLLFSDTQD